MAPVSKLGCWNKDDGGWERFGLLRAGQRSAARPVQAREDIKTTDVGPIIRSIEGMPGETNLMQRRWGWPGQNKRPVYNFRSDGCEFASNRCLIVADGFYEFTDPVEKEKRKDKWLFTKRDDPFFCIARIWRDTKDVGEAITMLTMEPGPNIVRYHDRQIVILDFSAWADCSTRRFPQTR